MCERRHQKRKVPRSVDLAADANERTSVKGTLDKTRDSVKLCIPEDDVKYRLTRVSLERFNLFLVETGCACNLEVRALCSKTQNWLVWKTGLFSVEVNFLDLFSLYIVRFFLDDECQQRS